MRRAAAVPIVLALAAGCSAPPVPREERDPQMPPLVANARLAFRQGQVERAERLYREALDRARAMDDAELISTEAYNLAVILMDQGKYEAAGTALDEALAEATRAGADPWDVVTAAGKLAYLEGKRDEAARLADRILAAPKGPADGHRFDAHVIRARLALDANEPARATTEADAAEALAGKDRPSRRAAVAGIRGRLFLAEGRLPAAGEEFDRESDGLREAARFPEMASALVRAGDAYAKAGDLARAADRLYRAGRTRAGRKEGVEALSLLDRAVDAATRAGDRALAGRAAALRDEVRAAVRPATPAPPPAPPAPPS